MRAIAFVGIVQLAACAYEPGSFHSTVQDFHGRRVTFACLDLAVDRRADLSSGDSVLHYSFGNRCDYPTVVDLAGTDVVGHATDGRVLPLSPYDPDHEIVALWLDGRAVGAEAIAYPTSESLYQLCVDAAAIAHASEQFWLCFE